MQRQAVPATSPHPIHDLPIELLARIFVHCTLLPGKQHTSAFDSPLLLTHICRSWRAIALATRRLWSIFAIDLSDGPHASARLLSAWLDRSGVYPLVVSLSQRQTSRSTHSEAHLLPLIATSIPRWREARIHLRSSILPVLFSLAERDHAAGIRKRTPVADPETSQMEEHNCQELPHLRRLSLCVIPDGGTTPKADLKAITMFADAPRLTEVTLIKLPPHPDAIWLPWAQLRVLSVQCPDADAALGALILAPNLRKLFIKLERSSRVAADRPAIDVGAEPCPAGERRSHAALESLSIAFHPGVDTRRFGDVFAELRLDLPVLKSLTLTDGDPIHFDTVRISAEHAPVLEHLTLHVGLGTTSPICELLASLTSARILELREVSEPTLRELLLHLAYDSGDSDPEFLPHLESIHIDGLSFAHQFDLPLFCRALRRREDRIRTFTITVLGTSRSLRKSAKFEAELEYLQELRRRGKDLRVQYLCGKLVF
uniref:F-box domain-containing protein n=1 Tax=Mycena chlorophos TaxID=658473 RepID=A0ABQ0LLW5_MYCCL|nr:predicted protein [Mycena chlorophos]